MQLARRSSIYQNSFRLWWKKINKELGLITPAKGIFLACVLKKASRHCLPELVGLPFEQWETMDGVSLKHVLENTTLKHTGQKEGARPFERRIFQDMFANLPTYQFCFSFVESTERINENVKKAVQCWSHHARIFTPESYSSKTTLGALLFCTGHWTCLWADVTVLAFPILLCSQQREYKVCCNCDKLIEWGGDNVGYDSSI